MTLKTTIILGLILLLSYAAHLSNAERIEYTNYRLYKVTPATPTELDALKLISTSDSLIFLDEVHAINRSLGVLVAPHKLPDFLELMKLYNIENELLESDFQTVIDQSYSSVASYSSAYDWTHYHELDDTYAWLARLAERYPDVVELIEGGKTYEGRSILGVKISHKTGAARKPGVFIEAGIHAREWISPATATYIIKQLLRSDDAGVKTIARNLDWYIFPHVNPDGYVFTHTTDHLWRKTRTPHGSCIGADPNRNWDFHWGEEYGSDDCYSDTYAGPKPFSEVETRTLSNYIRSLKDKLQLYISFHSYSQLLMYPYGFSRDLKPANQADFELVTRAALKALSRRYGTKYRGGDVANTIYPAAGTSVDWAYAVANISLAFVYELRPTRETYGGFVLPEKQIIPSGEETLDSLVGMIGKARELGYLKV